MWSTAVLPLLFVVAACGSSSQKPFDQMTAQEHLAAAARENEEADQAFSRIRAENIEPPETLPSGDVYAFAWAETGGNIPYTYEERPPDAYIAWPRVSDPSEHDEDAASKHRENALRHERAAAALEGHPDPQPLPPPQPPLIPPDHPSVAQKSVRHR